MLPCRNEYVICDPYILYVILFPKVAGLDLNERKGSAQRYIPPHLRGGDSNDSSSNSLKQNDNNYQGGSNNFRENYSNNRGTDRDYNNR